MKKRIYILAVAAFLAVQFCSLNHLYDSEHFLTHDSSCEQCQFLDQFSSTDVPAAIVPTQVSFVYLPMPETDIPSLGKTCFSAYFGQAPPHLILMM